MGSEVFKLVIFFMFPSLYFLIAIFNLKNHINKLLYYFSIFIIIFCYYPPLTSDLWNIKVLYEEIKNYTFLEMIKLKIDFIIPFIMWLLNKLNLPFRFFLFYVFFYYYVVIRIFEKYISPKKYMIIFFSFAMISSTMRVIENPRFPLATISFICGILVSDKFTLKKVIIYIITIFLHLGYLPFVLIACISQIKINKVSKFILVLSTFFIVFDIDLIKIIFELISNYQIENQYLKSKIWTYFINPKRVEETVKINWTYYLHSTYYIFLVFYLLFEKNKKDSFQNIIFLLLSLINILHPFKTLFYRYVLGIFLIGIVYVAKCYGDNTLKFKKVVVIFHILLLIYSIITWIRLLTYGYQSMDWTNNLVVVLFKIIQEN